MGVPPRSTVDAGVKLVPWTVTVVADEAALIVLGLTPATVGNGYDNATEEEPVIAALDWLAAVTVTVPVFVDIVAGAVYRPVVEIVPTVLLPPAIAFTLQLTAEL
jgi:hypothetical protein